MIIKFHLNLEEIKIMPAGTVVLLLFLLAVAPWEALPHPCWARASCPCHFHCAQAEFSPAELRGAFI